MLFFTHELENVKSSLLAAYKLEVYFNLPVLSYEC